MRAALLFVILTAAPALSQPPPDRAKAKAAAALALAASCDCPVGDMKCGRVVADVLARVSAEIDAEAKRPAVAPPPKEKAEPVAVVMPAAFVDSAGCTWTETAPGSGVYARTSCPARR